MISAAKSEKSQKNLEFKVVLTSYTIDKIPPPR